jgi:hypothetical protein
MMRMEEGGIKWKVEAVAAAEEAAAEEIPDVLGEEKEASCNTIFRSQRRAGKR